MSNEQSLSSFFHRIDPTTLGDCDREPIHLSGAIQAVGALLVIDPGSGTVVGASTNASHWLGTTPERLLGASLESVDAELAEQVLELESDGPVLHEVLDFVLDRDGVQFDTVTHVHDGRRVIEFLPNSHPSATEARRHMRTCSKTCAQIMNADTFEDAARTTVDAVRRILGFSRVKLYRFLPDWSGETMAESRDETLPSYLGLHFPDGDIPRQVREIMTLVPYRAIGTTSDESLGIHTAGGSGEPIDLTWSVLRSVSPMHTAYLRNMGVGATFTCSLTHRGRLWGLIAAHNLGPELAPFDKWSLVNEIGAALMLRHDHFERVEVADTISELRRIENRFASALKKSEDLEEVIGTLVPTLREFLGADGFAFQYGTQLHLCGRTPPPSFIRELVTWATGRREASGQFQTTMLHREFPPAGEHMDTACGVLIQPIVVHRVCQLIWFRGPITRRVEWAGRPPCGDAADASDPVKALGPRSSFERWVNEHDDQSAPWRESEIESAREIFQEFLDIITAQLLLKRENASLRDFAASAAHDLKAPLRGISAALDIMSEENFEADVVKETHAMAHTSARRLGELTSSLLELALMDEQELSFEPTDLSTTLEDVREMLSLTIEETGAELEIGPLPRLVVNEPLILRLFLNLVGNALKYRHPDRAPSIRISAAAPSPGRTEISVEDNGLGIEPRHAERIFQPMQRLHSSTEIEGSGLGLTICQRVLEAHAGSIRLDTERERGSRFVVTLPAAA